MFKLFSRSKGLQRGFGEPLGDVIGKTIINLKSENDKLKEDNRNLREQSESDYREIIALKGIVANLRKQKVYAGQRFYDPKNHKAPVVYLCARWNEWYMIRRQNQTTPLLITAEHWTENFGHYELMPRPNTNLRNLG